MQIAVRPARWDDLPAILDIYASARRFMAAHGNPDQWGDDWPPEDIVRADVQYGTGHVCLAGDEVVGVFALEDGEDPCYSHIDDGAWLDDGPYSAIHRLASAGRARGVASACFDWAYARRPSLKIDTHEANLPMRRAIERWGFLRCGTVYVRDREPRIAYQSPRHTPPQEEEL